MVAGKRPTYLGSVEDGQETVWVDGIKASPVADGRVGDVASENNWCEWLVENAAGFAAQSAWHELHGHPLADILMHPARDIWKSEPKISCFPDTASVGEGVTAPLRAETATMWRQQNAGAITDYNEMIETNGIPLSEFRKF